MWRLARFLPLTLLVLVSMLAANPAASQCLVCPCIVTHGENGYYNCTAIFLPDGSTACQLANFCYGWTGPGGGGGGDCAQQPDPMSPDNVLPCSAGGEIRPAFSGVVAAALFETEAGGSAAAQDVAILASSASMDADVAERMLRSALGASRRMPLGPTFVTIRPGGAVGFVRTTSGSGYAVRAHPNDRFTDLEIDGLTSGGDAASLARVRLREQEVAFVPVVVDAKNYVLALWSYTAPNNEQGVGDLLSEHRRLREQLTSYSGPRAPMAIEPATAGDEIRTSWGAMKSVYR